MRTDDPDLYIPDMPIKRVKRKGPRPERVDQVARSLLRAIDGQRLGPAGLARAMEVNRLFRPHRDIQEHVVRRARQLLVSDDQEEETVAAKGKKPTKAARMHEHIREVLADDPGATCSVAYDRLPAADREGMKESSFSVSYWYPMTKRMREAGELPERGTSEMAAPTEGDDTPAPDEGGTPAAERVVPDPVEEEPGEEEGESVAPERSEADPSPGAPAENGRRLQLVGPAGEMQATQGEDGNWRLEVDCVVDWEHVDGIANALYPVLLEKPVQMVRAS